MTTYSAAVMAHMLAHQERYIERKMREMSLATMTAIEPYLMDIALPSLLNVSKLRDDNVVVLTFSGQTSGAVAATDRWLERNIRGTWRWNTRVKLGDLGDDGNNIRVEELHFEHYDDAALFYLRFK
jgi:hypothetical protein